MIIIEKLEGNRTYYVRTDGSDSNNGLTDSANGAFLTVQRAIDEASSLHFGIYDCKIKIANGTYTGQIVGRSFANSGGKIIIEGDTTTPANVKLQSSTGSLFTLSGVNGTYQIKGVETQTSTVDGMHLASYYNSVLEFGAISFSSTGGTGSHLHTITAGSIICIDHYTISGGAHRHYYADIAGTIVSIGQTVTVSSAVTFTQFAIGSQCGVLRSSGNTFVNPGYVTGTRYLAQLNGVIHTNGSGASYFPGTTAGSTATGGQYY